MECPDCGHGMWYREHQNVYVCPHCDNHIDIEEDEEDQE